MQWLSRGYQRLKDHGVAVTEIIERGYGKTFYFHDPNGIRLQIELKIKRDADSLEGDPDPIPYVRALLQGLSAAHCSAYTTSIQQELNEWEP